MSRTAPTRVDDELFEEAKVVGNVLSRSAAQQITHWARIGREIELANMASGRVWATLSGRQRYDTLDGDEQAFVRAEWAQQMDARRADLDFASEFERDGRAYVELDKNGNVARRGRSD